MEGLRGDRGVRGGGPGKNSRLWQKIQKKGDCEVRDVQEVGMGERSWRDAGFLGEFMQNMEEYEQI